MERHISDDGSHKVGINVFRQRHHDQRLRFRDGKDPEGPEESLAYYYDDIQEAEKGVADFTADEHGSAEAEMESGGQKSGQVAGRNYFGRHHQTYQQQQRRRQDEGEGVEDDSPPYGARIEHDEHGGGHHWAGGMYDMEPFRYTNINNNRMFLASHLARSAASGVRPGRTPSRAPSGTCQSAKMKMHSGFTRGRRFCMEFATA